MEFTEFWTILSTNGIVLDIPQIEQFKRYHKELKYWNEKINLISRKDESNILERHFLHSLAILKYVEFPTKARCLDIGTGGGLPGIPLKIASPLIYMTLCDSIKKKLKTTEMFAKHTELRNISCFYGRVEDLQLDKQQLRHYDIICSRAVAPITKLLEWSLPLLKQNGKYVLLKGGDLSDEIGEAIYDYPGIHCTTIDIEIMGCDWFTNEEKKIVLITK
ncbi:MAG: 16S rRNA (guanine(527)-N(7))-methyltransferase RsmG [Ignavibacteria bacterium]|jgi:16S rRNA (guanine527-N7)-methyltransferase|nr:16S rRNA (guanine(527)-N(7))-methyltransferase RsmG [Ignavibacteria bacterium]